MCSVAPQPAISSSPIYRPQVRTLTILERNQEGLKRLQAQLDELERSLHTFLIDELVTEDEPPIDLSGKSELYGSLEMQEQLIRRLETRLRRLMARIDVT